MEPLSCAAQVLLSCNILGNPIGVFTSLGTGVRDFFKHPAEASSWGMKVMQQISALDGVRVVKFDFCMLGMKTIDEDGEQAAARKRTKVMTI